jgi:GT2 family glycosyltransferase
MSSLKIATLITCHNRKAKTLACLEKLYRSNLPKSYSLDVFLVDDGSIDGTADAVKTAFSQVKIIIGNGSLYWNRGMHLAWQTAAHEKDYDYYLWLNDDTYVFENTLDVLLSAADATKNEAIIVAASCSNTTGELTYCGFQSDGNKVSPADKLVQIDMFNGNCVLVPKFVHQAIGNLDPLFHHSIGDFDYGLRARKKGIKSFVAPNYLAHCESHNALPKWCLPSVSLKERLLLLYSPLGHCQPYYFFRFELRHFGFFVALKHLISVNLRMLIPSLWIK